jgi:hypothetical protein
MPFELNVPLAIGLSEMKRPCNHAGQHHAAEISGNDVAEFVNEDDGGKLGNPQQRAAGFAHAMVEVQPRPTPPQLASENYDGNLHHQCESIHVAAGAVALNALRLRLYEGLRSVAGRKGHNAGNANQKGKRVENQKPCAGLALDEIPVADGHHKYRNALQDSGNARHQSPTAP